MYLLTYLFICLIVFTSLFLYLFISLFICLFIYLFVCFFVSSFLRFFVSSFALDIQFVVRKRESLLGGLPPASPDSVPKGEELWKALKRDPIDKQRVESLLESRAPVDFREPSSPQVSFETILEICVRYFFSKNVEITCEYYKKN